MQYSHIEKGQALMTLVIIVLFVGLLVTASFVFLGLSEARAIRNLEYSVMSYYAADAGVEDLLLRSRDPALDMPLSYPSVLSVGGGNASSTYSFVGINETFTSQGAVSNRFRRIMLTLSRNTQEVNFNYGVQVGDLGVKMNNNSRIVGNIYSNGSIEGAGNDSSIITGDVIVAGNNNQIHHMQITGNAKAAKFLNCTIGGIAYYLTSFTNCTASSTQILSSAPPAGTFPIAQAQMDVWKAEAEAGGTLTGYTLGNNQSASLGPVKVNGTMILGNDVTLALTGTVWVTGMITFGNNVTIQLAPEVYGGLSGVFASESPMDIRNTVTLRGTGQSGSYLLVLDTFGGLPEAIDIGNNATGAILYAPNGEIDINNNLTLSQATGRGLELGNNVSITYESGLADIFFTGGPSGGDTFRWEETY